MSRFAIERIGDATLYLGDSYEIVPTLEAVEVVASDPPARDKARDRFLMIKGWPVLRFTGSEIHRDAAACAEAVVDALHTQWHSGGGRVEDLQRIFDA